MALRDEIDSWIAGNVGSIKQKRDVDGSGWSSCMRYTIDGSDQELFVKASTSKNLESMFLGEALGLRHWVPPERKRWRSQK